MSTNKLLYNGKYYKIVGIDGFEILLEDAHVFALPLVLNPYTGIYELVVRSEPVPSYTALTGEKEQYLTILSGTVESGESTQEAIIREIGEEAGIFGEPTNIELLQFNIPICKSTSMRSSLYAVIYDHHYERTEPEGDGSAIEKQSKSIFLPLPEVENVLRNRKHDFLIYAGYNIIMNWIRSKGFPDV